VIDENDDMYREEPERIRYARVTDYISDLKIYALDMADEVQRLQKLVNDLDRCRFTPCNSCKHFIGNQADFCELDLDNRIKDARLFWTLYAARERG